ncbi:MAG: glycosyltransferase family 2 protein [Candidatus Gracilibacteria bacterium]
MKKPLVSIVIINYNTRHLLDGCIRSLNEQTYRELEIIFIDNLSTDGSCDHVKKHHPNVIPVCNDTNLGYSEGANQGIKMAKGDFIMLLNPDILFEKDYIEKCITKMEEDQKIAAIAGKLYKYDFQNHQKTKFIDTAGLFCYRNRRVIDNGQGLEDEGQFDTPKEVFGISGACPIYRKKALEDVKIPGRKGEEAEYLDKDFFMYKEDVDISWRFLLFGWKSYYLPSAVANHGRGTGVLKRFTHWEVYKNRSKLNKFQKYYSFKNQRLMQLKNELFMNFLQDFFPILLKEILIFFYVLFREPYLIKAWLVMWTQVPSILRKRRYIMKHRKAGWRQMHRWLSGKKSEYLLEGK